jgi:hypothetical protein
MIMKSRNMIWAGNASRMGRTEMLTKLWLEILKGKDHSEELGVDGRIIKKAGLMEIGREGVDWIDLAQDRDRWRALVTTVINLEFRRGGDSPTSQEGLV